MKKLSFQIRKGTKSLILGLSLLGILGLSAMKHSRSKVTMAFAPIGLVAAMKKKGITMDEGEEKLFGEFEAVFSEHLKGVVDETALKAALDKITPGMTAEQTKSFEETVETVKKQAILLDQLKSLTNGDGTKVDASVMGQIRKGLAENIEEIKKFQSKEKGAGFKIEIKAAGAQTIGATTAYTTAGTAIAFPTPEVIAGLNDLQRNQPFLVQIMSVSGTSSANIVWQEKINPQGQAQFVGENVLAPMVSFDIEVGESRAKMVTAQTVVSTQMLDDIEYMAGEIEKEIIYQINILLDTQLLSGTGTGDNLKGIAAYVGGYVLTTVKTDNPNTSDAILAACTQIVSLNFRPNIACLNPIDFANTKLLKGTTGYYIVNPNDKDNSMGGVPVIQSNQVPVGKVLVMDTTRTNVKILQGLSINFGWVNDNFTKHMVTIMGDMRVHNYIKANDIAAFVYDDIVNIKTAIANI